MLKLRVIPCLDVKDGRVVKGVNFVALRDAGDPVEQAAVYDAAGADELTFLDITASHENRDTILHVVARTAERVFLPLTVGGGIRSIGDMRNLLLAGADKCSINSAAVARPGAGARGRGKIRQPVRGGRGRRANRSLRALGCLYPWRPPRHRHRCGRVVPAGGRLGAGEILLTSMDRDGTGRGFDLRLLRAVCGAVRVPVIASGGVGTLAHFVEGARGGRHRAAGGERVSISARSRSPQVKAGAGRGRPAGAPAAPGAGGLSQMAKKNATRRSRRLASGSRRCRARRRATAAVLDRLWGVVMSRRLADPTSATPPGCCRAAPPKVAQKFGEEAVECLIEAVAGNREALIAESADVLYHLSSCGSRRGAGRRGLGRAGAPRGRQRHRREGRPRAEAGNEFSYPDAENPVSV